MWERYQYLVDYISKRVARTLPQHVPLDDLKSAGQFGLLDAINKYDPKRGFKFETYAMTRVRGSILDDLRSQDWVPRSVRQKDRNIETAIQELTQYYGRDPTDEEVAGLLDITLSEYRMAKANSQNSVVYNLDQPVDPDGSITIADSLSTDAGDLSDLLAIIDMDRVLSALGKLRERERLTIALHYRMGLTLAEIGRQFGVTESRVCQIHTKALRTIRSELVA